MRRLKNRSLVPPDDFRFTDPDTGITTKAIGYDDWVSTAKDRRRLNNLPIALDFEAQMQDQLCRVIPPEYCERDAGDVSSWVNTRFSWDDFKEGMKAFGHWAALGASLVTAPEAARRGAICVTCPLNVHVSGCAACHKTASLITGAVAQKRTAHDDYLRACAVCHCALKAMVWFPIDVLNGNETSERQRLRPDFCWLKHGGENYGEHPDA